MNIWVYIVVFAVGFIAGYIIKDLLTVEKKVEVVVKKQKIKGDDGGWVDIDEE